jgi:Tfp pilus assembly protein PilN
MNITAKHLPMAQDINLLPEQSGEDKQKLQQRKMLTQVSVGVLVLTIVAVAGLFAGKLFLQVRSGNLDKDIAAQDQRIKAKHNEEGVYRTLDAKLTSLSSFLAGQKHFSTFFENFSQTVPDSMSLTDVTIDENGLATITGKVSTYADLAGFYDKLRMAEPEHDMENMDISQASMAATPEMTVENPYFVNPRLASISRDDQSGAINFQISFTLSPDVLAAGAES